jgi:hypothetical protein
MSLRAFISQNCDPGAPGYCEQAYLGSDGVGRAIGVANNLRITRGRSLYFLEVPSGHYKVGVSEDPPARKRQLQCGCPEPITLACWTNIRDDGVDPAAFERLLHDVLAPWHASGEWFKVPTAVLARAYRETWVRLRYPPLYQRWQRFSLYARAVDTERRRSRRVEAAT